MIKRLLLISLALLFIMNLISAAQVVITPADITGEKFTTIKNGSTTGQAQLEGAIYDYMVHYDLASQNIGRVTTTSQSRALLYMNVSGYFKKNNLTANSVTSAILSIYIIDESGKLNTDNKGITISAYNLSTFGWKGRAAGSSSTWINNSVTIDGSTMIEKDFGTNWGAYGGDFQNLLWGSSVISAQAGNKYFNITLNSAYVSNWISNQPSEKGLLLKSDETTTFDEEIAITYISGITAPKIYITYVPMIEVISPTDNQLFTTPSVLFNVTTSASMTLCRWTNDSGISNNTLTRHNATAFSITNTTMTIGNYNIKYYCNKSADGTWQTSAVVPFLVNYTSIPPTANVYINYPTNTTTISSYPGYLIQINSSINPSYFNITNMTTFLQYRNGTFISNISNFTINTNNSINITHNFYLNNGSYSVKAQYCGYSYSNLSDIYCFNSSLINFQSNNTPITFNSFSYNKSFWITEFIKVNGTNFTLAGQPYFIMGADAYYLSDYATNHTYDDDGNEINNSQQYVLEILNEAQYLNMNVIRTWANMQGGNSSTTTTDWELNNSGGHHNLFLVGNATNFSEEMFKGLDYVIYEASKRDIRLQLVLINNWDTYGGMKWYVLQSPTTLKTGDADFVHDQFYNDSWCMQMYQAYVNYTLNRVNTYSGIKYKDDPAIFAWLLANEPRAKSNDGVSTDRNLIRNWAKNMTAFIKSQDTNHLVGLGIEGLGYLYEWDEGTDMINSTNGTGVDFATFELHPDQWDWFAQGSENATNGYLTGGITSNSTIDWWTNGSGYSYGYLWRGKYVPQLGRHQYQNWIEQNVNWSNQMNLPVLLQEVALPSNMIKTKKDRFFQQAIHNFFNTGGDGMMMWNLNHDQYYYSTNNSASGAGAMDDGYSFYVSDDPILKNISQGVIDAFNFTMYDNNGGSWVTYLNNYQYQFIANVNTNVVSVQNCSLILNVSNGTYWTYSFNQTNSTPITLNTDYIFTQQFAPPQKELYWQISCRDNNNDIYSSTSTYLLLQDDMPIITQATPNNNEYFNKSVISLIYNVTDTLDISNCQLYINDILNQTSTSIVKNINQSFSTSIATSGVYNWSIKCTDVGNNIGYSLLRNFTVDFANPTVLLNTPSTGTYRNASSTNFTVNLTDNIGIKNVSLYIAGIFNNAVTFVEGTLTASVGIVVTLVDGAYDWSYLVYDWGGNSIMSSNNTLTIDTIAPLISIVYPTNYSYYIPVIQLNYTISGSPQACWYYNNSQNVTIPICGNNITVTSALGDNLFIVYANDTAGNINSSRVYFHYQIANAVLLTPANNSYLNTSQNNFTANITAGMGISNATIYIYNQTELVNKTTFYYPANPLTDIIGIVITLIDDIYSWFYQLIDVNNYKVISSNNYTLTIDATQPNITIKYPLPITYLISPTEFNFTIADKNLETCWYSNDTVNTTLANCGLNATGLQAINGTNKWIVYANDTYSNLNSRSITFTYLSLGQTVTLNSPINYFNYTVASPIISFNYTITQDNLNLTNITLYLYNNTDQSLLSKTVDYVSINNSINRIVSLPLGESNYSWNIYSCGYQLDNVSNVKCNFASSNQSFKILNQSISPNIYTNITAERFNFISIKTNVSIGYDYSFSYCNFSLRNPAGNILLINNKSTAISNGMVESNKVYLNQSGTYYANLTCYNNIGNSSFKSLDIVVPNYTLYNQPSEVYQFSARYYKNETNSFDILSYDNTLGEVYYNLTIAVEDRLNFSIALSQYSVLLNSTESSGSPKTITFSINASNNIANGTFSGNITFTNSTYNLTSYVKFIYGISPPSGMPTMLSLDAAERCTTNATSLCYKSFSMIYGGTYRVSYLVKNTADYALQSCQLKISKTTISQDFSSWTTFTPTNFTLAINETKQVNAAFDPTDFTATDRYYSGFSYVECLQGDLAGNVVTSNITNRPYLEMYIVMPVGYVSGGGGSTPPKKIYVNVTSNKTFCGDGICQNSGKGNDLGIVEDFYSCSQDCPAANLDTLIFGCFDKDPKTACVFSQALYQYIGLIIGILLAILIFGTTRQEGKEVPLYRYFIIAGKRRKKK